MWGILGFLRQWWERPSLLAVAEERKIVWEDPDSLGYVLKHSLVEAECPDYIPDNIMAL